MFSTVVGILLSGRSRRQAVPEADLARDQDLLGGQPGYVQHQLSRPPALSRTVNDQFRTARIPAVPRRLQ